MNRAYVAYLQAKERTRRAAAELAAAKGAEALAYDAYMAKCIKGLMYK